MMDLMLTDTRYYTLFYLRYQLLSALGLYFTGFADNATALLQESLSGTKHTSKQKILRIYGYASPCF
jgi:hypothetical protein